MNPPQRDGVEMETCDGRLDVDHRLLLPHNGRAVVDNAQRHVLGDASLGDEMLLENVVARLAFSVEHLAHRQLVGRRKQHR